MADGTVNGSSHSCNGATASGEEGEGMVSRVPSLMNGILLVEDDVVIVDLLTDVLCAAGYDVLVAGNATDGLSLFRENVQDTLCVVLDYEIPGMHPKRLLERFTDIDPQVRVILSSGYPQSYISREFPVDRLAGYLPKPYDPQLLILELQRLSGR